MVAQAAYNTGNHSIHNREVMGLDDQLNCFITNSQT